MHGGRLGQLVCPGKTAQWQAGQCCGGTSSPPEVPGQRSTGSPLLLWTGGRPEDKRGLPEELPGWDTGSCLRAAQGS